uniref:Uncharacterized protein n=1 Tax=viral metagenome TaxID=1070528 RepID=A0A6M3M6G1_9ZZZZ
MKITEAYNITSRKNVDILAAIANAYHAGIMQGIQGARGEKITALETCGNVLRHNSASYKNNTTVNTLIASRQAAIMANPVHRR